LRTFRSGLSHKHLVDLLFCGLSPKSDETKAKYVDGYKKGEKGFKEYSKTPDWMTNTWKLLKGSDDAKAEVPKEAPKSSK